LRRSATIPVSGGQAAGGDGEAEAQAELLADTWALEAA
jgi:hypothetical protein